MKGICAGICLYAKEVELETKRLVNRRDVLPKSGMSGISIVEGQFKL